VSDGFALAELQNEPAFGVPLEPALAGAAKSDGPETGASARVGSPSSLHGAVRLQQAAKGQPGSPHLVMPQRKVTVRTGQRLAPAEPVLEPVTLPGAEPKFDKLARDVTDMVPV